MAIIDAGLVRGPQGPQGIQGPAGPANGNVDVVRKTTHQTNYTKDTLEFVTDSTGKVTNAYFMSK